MGAPYQSQSASGYNSSPPPDDGSTVASNKITWGTTIKAKLADPIKVLADAINTALRTALNVTPTTTSVPYTTQTSDHLTTIEVTGTTTISLGDAATMIAQSMGYTVTIYNKGSNTVTVALITNTNKLNGQTNGNITLPPQTAGTFTVAQSGTDYEMVSSSNPQTLSPPRSYLAGLGISTAGASTTITVAAGQAVDGGNTVMMTTAQISKTTSSWAVGSGNGGLDTGSIAGGTWYHLWLIMRPDTGVVDVLISLSATSPTMPANYTLKRRIGAWITTAGSNWDSITQDGDYFRWAASKLEFGDTNPGTSAVTKTLANVPTGVNVFALINWEGNAGAGGGVGAYVSDLAATDEAASNSAAPLTSFETGINLTTSAQIETRTNTSAQLRYRLIFSDGSIQVRAATIGWKDPRGRNA